MKLLLLRGVDIEARRNSGQTLLSWAAAKGHEDVVQLLLERGANIEAKDNCGMTPLSLAAGNGRETVVPLLLAKGGSVSTRDTLSRTPLSHAARGGHDTIVMALLSHQSVDPDQRDYYGSTPLSIATRNRHTETVKMLLATGRVTFDSPDSFGRTLWWWARRCGNGDIRQALLDYAEKRRKPVCENDEVIDASLVLNDKTARWCDVCTLGIPEYKISYQCGVCNGGNFDICSECYEIGGRCLEDDHELARRN